MTGLIHKQIKIICRPLVSGSQTVFKLPNNASKSCSHLTESLGLSFDSHISWKSIFLLSLTDFLLHTVLFCLLESIYLASHFCSILILCEAAPELTPESNQPKSVFYKTLAKGLGQCEALIWQHHYKVGLDVSVGRGTYCQVWRPKFNTHDYFLDEDNPGTESCLLISLYVS